MAASGNVDFAIATEGLEHFQSFAMPCYQWNRAIIVPNDHPLTQIDRPLSLSELSEYSIVTYVFGFTGRSRLDEAFEQEGLTPKVVFTAADADVIKTYVRLGLGLGLWLIWPMTPRPTEILLRLARVICSNQVSPDSISSRNISEGHMYRFVNLFAPHPSQKVIGAFMESQGRGEAKKIFESIEIPTL